VINHKQFAGDNSKSEPPDPFPNSEVKPLSADGSVGLPVRGVFYVTFILII